MKKNYLFIITFLLNYCISYGQNFGQFASAIKINNSIYNTTGVAPHKINSDAGAPDFDGASLGTFGANSTCAKITAGEIKTWKNASANVCGATLFWRVYTTGFPSGSFHPIPLTTVTDCDTATTIFNDGLGTCGNGDQKWKDYNLNENFATGLAPGNYTLEIYYEYTGSNTSTSTCETTQFISNNALNYKANFTITNPTITCPQNTIQEVDAGLCTASIVTTNPTIGDNCFITKLTWEITGATSGTSPSTGINNLGTQVFNKGTTTVTYTASDDANNSISCFYTITVNDNVPPLTPTLANVNVGQCAGTPTAPTTTDACAGTITGTTETVFPITTQGTTIVTWTFDDGNGNSTTANQNVIVDDNIPPTITAPINVNTTTNASCTAIGVALGTPVTGDNCSVSNITNDHPSTTYPLGNTTVIWTVTDAAGNSATANQTVTVTDTIPPSITCPANITTAKTSNDGTGNCTTTVSLGNPIVSDNCTAVGSLIVTNNAPVNFPIGVTTVTWTVKDAANNTPTCTQNVTVTDDEAPSITCPANITTAKTSNDGTGNCTTTVSLGNPIVLDNCTAAGSLIVSNNAPANFPIGVTTVTWTV